MTLPRFDLMGQEHDAWILIMAELRALGIEPNDSSSNRLIESLKYWGETLAVLRIADPSYVEKAFAEAQEPMLDRLSAV